ncbi:hypothetical protein ACX8Z9_04500 [Arthrobacter halodurans]|uniref:Uncharacterized protein n=1 Tax=Arthrobacter halodurans TaxID=516699 RepID=A0ABV4UQH5_9MICC
MSYESDRVFEGIKSEVQRDFARARFAVMWEKAMAGKLKFGPSEEVGELRTRPPILLEMRVQVNATAKDVAKRHLLRLYFTEPDRPHGMILALHFARKPSAGDPAGTQQRSIIVAAQRHDEGARNGYTWGYGQ